MGLKQKTMRTAANLLKMGIRVLTGNKATFVLAHIAEEFIPIVSQKTNSGTMQFYCPGKIPEWRAQTLLTKEPETIEWINSFNASEIFWDIGANVGVYSLYAALRKFKVLSFEPSPGNYYLLSKNIEMNDMDGRISALCIAFNDTTSLDSLYMSNTALGSACHCFAEATDWQGNEFTPSLKQAMIGFGIDDFIEQFNPPFPNHIKIDVDGIENKIINGAQRTLADHRLKSILIELDIDRKEYCEDVMANLEKAGLQFHERKHAPMFENTEFSSVYNHIFIRPDEKDATQHNIAESIQATSFNTF